METIKMATAALRSASDDLRKTTGEIALRLNPGTAVLGIYFGVPIPIKDIGMLLLDLAQQLEQEGIK